MPNVNSQIPDLLVEFMMCHLLKKFPGELYEVCVGVLQRVLSYQKRCRVRLTRDWRSLWAALIALLKFLVTNETTLLRRHNIFLMAQQVWKLVCHVHVPFLKIIFSLNLRFLIKFYYT